MGEAELVAVDQQMTIEDIVKLLKRQIDGAKVDDIERAVWSLARRSRPIDGIEDEKRMRQIVRFMPKEAKKIDKLNRMVNNRINEFRKQEAKQMSADDFVLTSGANRFGVRPLPRTLEEPERMDSVYTICEFTDDKGQQWAKTVRLCVWADWNGIEAVSRNKAMVARICGQEKLNFSTRMQTDVQTRAVLMWLQLRGLFYWDDRNPAYGTSMYFDSDRDHRLLRRIESEGYWGWLQNHTGINMTRADFAVLKSEVNALALNPEVSRGVVPRALFNRRQIHGKDYIYISNGDSWMMRIGASADGDGIERVPNGTDGVLFESGATIAPWELEDVGVDPFETCAPFSTANYDSPHGAMIAKLWMLSIAACQAAFPAILFTGKARSGKTRFAKALCELFGTRHRSASIDPGSAGKKDFWTVIDIGGIVNFDNVDTKINWFGDAMQQACTDGSFESRTLFKDKEVTTLRPNARIVLTANNPLFAAESGLSDRLQIVRLLPFNAAGGKEVADKEITDCIVAARDGVMTWIARTISKALADKESVEKNVCFRHPDYADFSLRCARALGVYDQAIVALKSAEFDKALLTIQNVRVCNFIYEALVYFFDKEGPASGCKSWVGRANQMCDLIAKSHPELQNQNDGSVVKQTPNPPQVGKVMEKYWEQLSVIFDVEKPVKNIGSGTEYTILGYSEAFFKCVFRHAENSQKEEYDDNDELDDVF